jgi:hypothetical protein
MSASEGSAVSALTFQLLAQLDAYEQVLGRLVACPGDIELYHSVSGHMDDLRLYAGAFPALSVPWVEVLIRHFELTHGLWWQSRQGKEWQDIRALHTRLVTAVHALRQASRGLLAVA